jgi:NAD(P)-dependent dehydrogenase (short-subunit alcohol dehydrogenase family)
MDVTIEAQMVAGVEQIEQEQGGVDILINNAGLAVYGSAEETPMEDLRYQFEVNFFGAVRLTQLVLPCMRRQRAGKIVNISSTAGKVYVPMGAWYAASKHALEGWSDSLRFEVQQFNIDVILIEPGTITTDIYDLTMEPMFERSGQGPYRDFAQAVAEYSRKVQEKPGASAPPSVIAKTISKALKAGRPRIRYAVGPSARLVISIRKWFGDRVYEWVLTRVAG